ncbi:hypothetical protein E2C01_066532 [Portunus trituberculatus]|uniref:Uncharacterized protein n=1 Tax=Portunus trituberculatus TaxID=210409 RepID=A0A5B7HUX7_PORTR|nr:hypothetical protein [Portunus trituberculatus]
MDVLDNEELLLRDEDTSRSIRCHSKKLRMGRCFKDVKKFSFSQRSIAAWNSLSEDVELARSVHSFTEKLDKCKYGDGATRPQCPGPVKLQLGKYTHTVILLTANKHGSSHA